MEFRVARLNPTVLAYLSIAVPLAMVLLGEGSLFVENKETAITVHLLNVLLCVMAPFLLKTDPAIWQAFSLVSMLRVLNLGMPTFDTLTIYWLPLIYGPVILVAFLMLRDETFDWKDYLLKAKKFLDVRPKLDGWKVWYLPAAILLALVLANIEFKVLSMSIDDLRMIPSLDIEYLIALFVVMVFFIGLGEELIFRYVLQTRLEGVLGVMGAIMIASVAFAAMHSGYESGPYIAYVFLVSFLLGSLYYKTKSLAFVTLLHGLLNFLLFSFLPFGYLILF